MTDSLHVCRHCQGLIADPDDAVLLGVWPSISGPGYALWAHRAHVALVRTDPAPAALLARIRAAHGAGT